MPGRTLRSEFVLDSLEFNSGLINKYLYYFESINTYLLTPGASEIYANSVNNSQLKPIERNTKFF